MATLHASVWPVNLLKRPISQGTKCCAVSKLAIFRASNKSTEPILTAASSIIAIMPQNHRCVYILLCYFTNESQVSELMLKLHSGLLQFGIFHHIGCSVSINKCELLCRRLHSKVCIYCSLFLQCKFLKLPFWDVVKAPGIQCQQDSISQF